MDDHYSNSSRSTNSVADDTTNFHDMDQGASSTLFHMSAYSPRGMEAGAGGTGTVDLSSSWVQDPEQAPCDVQHQEHGPPMSAPPMPSVAPSSINPTFATQISTNPRSVTVRFQPVDTYAPPTTAPTKQSVYGGVAPYATAFASSLDQATEPQPYCAPSVRLHLARYERFWSLNPWDTAHPVTANKVFTFLDSHVLTLGHQNTSYPPVVKDTIDAFDTYRRDNSHLAVYSYPQELWFDSKGQLMSLRHDPQLHGLESLESCFINRDQAYKTFINVFRLYMHGIEDGSGRTVVDPTRLHGAMRQRTVLLLARWLIPRIPFSIVPHLSWANLTVDMLPGVEGNRGETRHEDLYLTALIHLPREDGVSNGFMYTACRHQFAELCPIGALAWYFFSEFHVAKSPPPDFALYVRTPTGEIFRPWQSFVLIPDAIFLHADLVHYTPLMNRGRDIKVGTKLSPDEYSSIEAESHNGGRRGLKPPGTLLEPIFPWIEQERRAYSQRLETQGPVIATDFALCRFLDTLVWLRTVILQDAVIFAMKYSNCHILRMPLFDCMEFRKYAAEARDSLMLTPIPASTPSGQDEANSSKVMISPLSTQLEVEHTFPSPLPLVDAVFNALGNENIELDTIKTSLTAGDIIEKVATTTKRAPNLSPRKRSSQAGRLSSTKNGHREKPRDIRPAGPFWEHLTGIDTIL